MLNHVWIKYDGLQFLRSAGALAKYFQADLNIQIGGKIFMGNVHVCDLRNALDHLLFLDVVLDYVDQQERFYLVISRVELGVEQRSQLGFVNGT